MVWRSSSTSSILSPLSESSFFSPCHGISVSGSFVSALTYSIIFRFFICFSWFSSDGWGVSRRVWGLELKIWTFWESSWEGWRALNFLLVGISDCTGGGGCLMLLSLLVVTVLNPFPSLVRSDCFLLIPLLC